MQNEFALETEAATQDIVATLDNSPQDETGPPFDPVRFIATHMLQAALAKPGQPFAVGFHIVVVPSDDWLTAIREVARNVHLGGAPRGRKRRMVGSARPELHALELPASADAQLGEAAVRNVQQLLSQEQAVLLIVSRLATVPHMLQVAADQILHVSAPQRPLITALIHEMAPNTQRLEFGDLACERLTPAMLRLAFRSRLSPRAFLGRLRALAAVPPRPSTPKAKPLEQLHGVDEVKAWALALKGDLERYQRSEISWDQLSRGLLLAGAPGTAKTTCAASVAEFCGLNYVATSYADWQRNGQGHLGHVLQGMATSFTTARARKPCILFIDELDSVGQRGGDGQRDGWWRSIINALLEQLDGSSQSNEGVIFVGATNHPDLIDPALLRSGRMEDYITLRAPDATALAAIFRDELADKVKTALDFEQFGRISAGMTGADVVKFCKAARRRARTAGRPVTAEDLLAAISGGETQLSADHRRRAAIHEAGHAIAALSCPDLRLEHVSIVGWGQMSGGASMGLQNGGTLTPSVLHAYLTAILAGRAAEAVLLGEISAGAGGPRESDLGRATQLAAEAELTLCLRPQGLIWYAAPSGAKLTDLLAKRPDLARAVQARLDYAYAEALELIKAKAPQVHRLAERLLAAKVLTGEEVTTLLRNPGDANPPSAAKNAPGHTIH